MLADAPINISLSGTGDDISALGVGCVFNNYLQRFSAEGEQILPLITYLTTAQRNAHLWTFVLYSEAPEETVDIQPFSRPWRGIQTFFIQQGRLEGIHDRDRFPIGDYLPISCTDQERAYSVLLERLRRLWVEGRPDDDTVLALIADYAGRVGRVDPNNFMAWDGERLFTYATKITEREHDLPVLAFTELKGKSTYEIALAPTLKLTVSTAPDAKVYITTHAQLLMEQHLATHVELIPPGGVVSFKAGGDVSRCDPVVFWHADETLGD